jgi:hypothetical protein
MRRMAFAGKFLVRLMLSAHLTKMTAGLVPAAHFPLLFPHMTILYVSVSLIVTNRRSAINRHKSNIPKTKEANTMDEEKRMIQNYEVKTAIHIGGKEVIFAEDLTSTAEPYMICDCHWDNPISMEIYDKAVGGKDYLEAMEEFLGRVSGEVRHIQQQRAERGISGQPLTVDQCIPGSNRSNYEGQLVVIRPESMVASARTADSQLLLATGGNGCSPDARGSAVFCTNLFTGKSTRWERTDVAGIILTERIPAWAREKLSDMGIPTQNFAPSKVYMGSWEDAKQKDELPMFHCSRTLNVECANSIGKAIRDCHDGENHYDFGTALEAVSAQYGMERVQMVLANTMERMPWDGRFSAANRQWGKGIELPDQTGQNQAAYVCMAHSALLDGFINRVRKAQQEKEKKPSVADQLKKPSKATPKKEKKPSRDEGR